MSEIETKRRLLRPFRELYSIGAFTESMTKKIFEDTDQGLLASA